MYEEFFGMRDRPFSLTPDPQFLYLSDGHQEALAHLFYAIVDGGGFVLLTGEIGTGKTSICRYALNEMPKNVDVALIVNPELTKFELLLTLCDEFGVPYSRKSNSHKELLDQLNKYLIDSNARGRHSIVIIDEAQSLTPDVLEQLRLLTNLETDKRKLLQIILVGQPELNETLQRNDLRQLDQRVASRYHLRPLKKHETEAYVVRRLTVAGVARPLFTKEAFAAVHRNCHGFPRLINILCDRALLGAFADVNPLVTDEIVETAAAEALPRPRATTGRSFRSRLWDANPDFSTGRNSMIPSSNLLRTPDAARYLALSVSTMSKMRLRGDGPAYIKVGARVIAYDISDLESWKASRRRKSTSDTGILPPTMNPRHTS
jgi:general secretion pathway protein A